MKIKRTAWFAWNTALALAIVAHADATITVDATKALGPVQSMVFGHNIEAGDGFGIFSKNHNYGQARTGDGLWNPDKAALVPEVAGLARDIGMKMLRYPGGCLVHGFNWKDAVGPVAQRPNFAFGVDEFLAACRELGAEPLMNVSDYTGTAPDAADLVEYLNAPADAAHPWAQKRAACGHPAPYGVRYFELGNESDHGNHDLQPPRKFTPAAYAAWFNAYAQAMRAVNPKIKLGALLGTGTPVDDSWNPIVLAGVKDSADFIIVHTYVVGMWSPNDTVPEPADRMMRACMASTEQIEDKLHRYRDLVRRVTGRALPLAVTEYNASFVQDKPLPYRFAYGPALFAADYLRVLLQPENSVLMANYWQFVNGYWGMVQGRGAAPQWKKYPAYYLFRLWGQHFGTQLIEAQVKTPRIDFEGLPGHTRPAQGDTYQPATPPGADLLAGQKLQTAAEANYRTETLPDGTLRATVTNLTGERYPGLATVHGPAGSGYLISFEARATGDFGAANMGLGMSDLRGWDATHSAIGVEGAAAAKAWQAFSGRFNTLPDATGAAIVWRLRAGAAPVSGTIEVRHLKVQPFQAERLPAYAAVTAAASLSPDGKTLYLIAFNKHHADAIATTLTLRGFDAKTAHRWTVTGPSLDALNTQTEQVRETASGVALDAPHNGVWPVQLPARSMTAFEFKR